MEQLSLFEEQVEEVKSLVKQGQDLTAIETHLLQKGIDLVTISKLVNHAKELRNALRTRQGSRLVLLGVVLLGIGFVSCIYLHYTNESISLPLYGLTILGLLILFAGLFFIFQ